TARGNRSQLKTIGTPRTINGVSKLLNPYECEIGITPKLRSVSVIPIVSQICSQSANSCSLRNRTRRGVPVVPDVSLNSTGGALFQSMTPLLAATETAASACCRLTDSSIGKTICCFRKEAKKSDGQSW